MNPDRPTLYLRFPKSRLPLVEMRVRVLPNAVQIEYSQRHNQKSIYIQKQKPFFDYSDEPSVRSNHDQKTGIRAYCQSSRD